MSFEEFYKESIDQPHAFWQKEAALVDWQTPFSQVLDYSTPPFAKWFVDGKTNLCHNAIDRWAASQGDSAALIAISTETNTEKVYSFSALQAEVSRMAAIMQSLGVGRGDRVLIYLPMIAEAAFAMLACARIGAIHSVVFGGFASHSLATRIDDAQPKLIVCSDAGSRGGKPVPYKPLLDAAIDLAAFKPAKVLMIDRKLAPMTVIEGRDVNYAALRAQYFDAQVPITWLESNEPSYILYTSGTTGKPKGVQRDVGAENMRVTLYFSTMLHQMPASGTVGKPSYMMVAMPAINGP